MSVLVAASLLGLRERDAQQILSRAEATRLHAYVSLATCEPLAFTAETAAYAAEQQRGQRLQGAARDRSIWREIDALELRGNIAEDAVVWPAGERWRDEMPLIGELTRHCAAPGDTTAQEYAALLHADASVPAVAYEKLRIGLALGHFERDAQPPPALPSELSDYAELLALEHRFASGEHTPAMRQAYAALAPRLPAEHDGLLVRQLQMAVVDGDTAALVGDANTGDGAVRQYRLALWIGALHEDDAAILAAAVADPLGAVASDNADLVRDRVRDAASRVPFNRETLAALEAACGKGRLTHEVYRVATLAAARHNLQTAKDAYVWILTHGKAMSGDIHTKLALVAMLTLDVKALNGELAQVTELSNAERQLTQLVTAVRSGGVRDPKIIQTLRQGIAGAHGTVDAKIVAELCAELDAAAHTKTLHLVLAGDQPQRQALAPAVQFAFPEPYALIPPL